MAIKIVSEQIEVELYDVIEDFEPYGDLIDLLGSARTKDTITIKINSGGGRIDVGWMIVNAIRESDAHVIARIVYPSYSMASLIAMACDDLVMDRHSLLMFHNYHGGSDGKGAELIENLTTSDQYIKDMFQDVATPFLTTKEMRHIGQDRDVYIQYNDPTLEARIKRHYKNRKAP